MTPRLGDRTAFPHLQPHSYLNHAAVSPLSEPVVTAARNALDDFARRGVAAVPDAMARREELRSAVAAFIGASPEDIGFPPGTTRGIVDLSLAMDWRPGDRVLLFDGEFPSNVQPWMTAARFGAVAERLPLTGFADTSGQGLQRVEDALKAGGVRLVAVSAVQFSTGLRMPIQAMADLAHQHGAELFVDAVQAVGGLPVAVGSVDYLVAGTHKWLMGLDGLAIAYAAPGARERLSPLTAGWLSTEDPLSFLFEGDGHLRYDRPIRSALSWMEGGVQTTAAFDGLAASLCILAELGPAAIAAHVQEIHDRLEGPLVQLGFRSGRAPNPAARSNILSLTPPPGQDLAAWARRLGEQGISVSTPDGWLRLSPHWPNHLNEVDRVLEAFEAVALQLGS